VTTRVTNGAPLASALKTNSWLVVHGGHRGKEYEVKMTKHKHAVMGAVGSVDNL
jgi:hypothetical protein